MDVLNLLAQGQADKQIAGTLFISRETVHKHLKNIYGKLGVHRRTEAIVRARELGLL
jgi:LuxR family maltose regulon positive regulatory protein